MASLESSQELGRLCKLNCHSIKSTRHALIYTCVRLPCAALHTSCGSSTVHIPHSSLDSLHVKRQHICLWVKHRCNWFWTQYITWDDMLYVCTSVAYMYILSHLDDLQLLQAVCSNACTIWTNHSGLAVDWGHLLTAVNLQTACSELSGRSSAAPSSLLGLNRMDDLRSSQTFSKWCTGSHSPTNRSRKCYLMQCILMQGVRTVVSGFVIN